jgi:hypothetical protein
MKRISGFWHPRNAYSVIALSPDMLLTASVPGSGTVFWRPQSGLNATGKVSRMTGLTG